MADWKGVVLRLIESSADLLRDIAIFLGSFQVKSPSSKSKAKELLVTSADQFFFFTFLFILKEIIAYFEQSEKQGLPYPEIVYQKTIFSAYFQVRGII